MHSAKDKDIFIYKITMTYVICLTILIPNFFNTCDQISFYEKRDKSLDKYMYPDFTILHHLASRFLDCHRSSINKYISQF